MRAPTNIILTVGFKAVKTYECTFDFRRGDVLKLLIDELGREAPWSISFSGLGDTTFGGLWLVVSGNQGNEART